MEKSKVPLMGTYEIVLEQPKRRLVIPSQLRNLLSWRNPEGTKFRMEGGTLEGLIPTVVLYDCLVTERKPQITLPASYLTRDGSLEHRMDSAGRVLIPQPASLLLGANEPLTIVGCSEYLQLVRTRDFASLVASPDDDVDRARALWPKVD
jgi:DNA-binding transcriptional regulator/RsmH inhibitor MraZ